MPEENTGREYEIVEELVPKEFVEEVTFFKIEEEYVTEEKIMSMVKSRYPFDGQGMTMAKGEVLK